MAKPTKEELEYINKLEKEGLSTAEAYNKLLEERHTVVKKSTKELQDQLATYMTLGDSTDAQILQAQALQQLEKQRVKDLEKLVAQGGEAGKQALEDLKVAKKRVEEAENLEKRLTNSTKAIKDGIEAAKGLGDAMGGVLGAYGKHSVLNAGNMWKVVKAFRGGTAGAIEFAKSLAVGLLSSFINSLIQVAIQVDEAESSFKRAAGGSDKMAKAVTSNWKATRIYGVELKEMGAAMQALKSTYTDFTMLNESAQKSVAKTGALLAEVGIKNEDFARQMQTGTKAFGLTAESAAAASRDIADFANVIGVVPAELGAQFADMGGDLAKMGDQGVRAFKDLAIVSKTTGLEMKKLLAITDKFDTFEGAATQAGKLNAALGGNFVNAMDLMMATDPAERFGMIRDSILDTGLTFDNMSYYQRKFYTDALGLGDVSDLAGVLSGDMSQLEGTTRKSSAEYAKLAKRTKDIQSMTEQFKTLMADLIPVMSDVVKELQAWTKEVAGNPKKMKAIKDGLLWFANALVTVGKGIVSATEYWYLFVLAWGTFKATQWISSLSAIASSFGLIGPAGTAAAVGVTEVEVAATGAAPAAGGLSTAITTVGQAAKSSAAGLLALGGMVLMIGAGIGLAALGAAQLVKAFMGLGDAAPWAAAGLIGFTVAFGVMMFALISLVAGPQAAVTAAAVGVLLAVGAAAIMIGAGVAIAALGIGEMAKGLAVMFGAMDVEKMGAFTLFVFTLGMLAIPLAIAAASLVVLTVAMFGLSFALLGVGLAIAILAALGIDKIVKGFAAMFEAIEIEKMIGFAVFIGTLAILSPLLALAAASLVVLAGAMFGLSIAMKLAPDKELENYSIFFSALANFDITQLSAIALGIGKINDEIEKLPAKKAMALTATMEAATMQSVVGGLAATAGAVTKAVAGIFGGDKEKEKTVQVKVDVGDVLLDGAVVGKFVKKEMGTVARDAMLATG